MGTISISRGKWRRLSAAVAMSAVAAAGCVGATAPGAPSGSPAVSPSATVATPTPAALTASPASSPTPIDLSAVPLAPSGTWKSIRWALAPTPSILQPYDTLGAAIFGWSRGYVGFTLDTTTTELGGHGTTTTTTTYSSDGVHWQAGTVLQQHPSMDNMDIRGVFEGPDGLLAVEESGACGDSWVEDLLTSSDGVTWQAVDMGKAFGKAVIWNVSGSSTGFVATDTVGHAVWTSRDGRSWQSVKLDTPAFATSRIDDGTAFSAGYVLVGSTQVTGARNCGAFVSDPSAPPTPTPTPPTRLPTVWWSADGTDWVKAELPGAKADYTVHMWVQRLDDHTLAAFDYYDNTQYAWVSNDGRTWKPLAQPVTLAQWYSDCREVCFMTDGRHGLQLQAVNGTPTSPLSLLAWTDGGLVPLAQSGDQPPYEFETDWAVGPTGVVVISNGQLWIGLPSSN